MSRNELNSFYQNAKREVQRAIENAKLCENKLDEYFSDVSRQMTKENYRTRDSKDNFKKAVKQFNLISELFFAINLELREAPENTKFDEIEDVERSSIPALLSSKTENNEIRAECEFEINDFERNSKFLNRKIESSSVTLESVLTPPLTPVREESITPLQTQHSDKVLPLRRPKEALRVPEKDKPIPYRQVDVSKFKPDFKFTGFISNIQNSSMGLVFVCDCFSDHFEDINDLSSDFKSNPSRFPIITELPAENNVFGIVLEDVFIRAIRQITANGEHIYLVDNGDIYPFSTENIFYKLPEQFQRYPGLAFFAQIVSNKGSRVFDIEHILERYESRSFEFTVVSVEDELIFLDVGSFKGIDEPDTVPQMVVTPIQREILMEEPLNTTNAMKAVIGYNPQDDKNLCKFTNAATGSCFKGANCRKVHLKQLEGGWTRDTDSVAAFDIPNKMDLPAIGTVVQVIPVFIADSHIIYCHFDNDTHPDIRYLEVHLNDPEGHKLLVHYKFPTSVPSMHELVLAKFTDGKWYRARVIDCYPEDDCYRVFFVDYGNSWSVELCNLRKWSPKFSFLPFQAVCVHLFGVRPINAKRSEAMDYLEVMVFDKTYKGLVKNNTNELTLDLFDSKGNRFLDDYLAAGLVEKKPMFEGDFDQMTYIPA